MSCSMQCNGATHIGKVRKDNQDQFLIADLNKSMHIYQTSLGLDHQARLFGGSQGKLLLVADGMGGHASGERASTLAVDCIASYLLTTMCWFFRLDEGSDAEFLEDLQEALRHCQKTLAAEVEALPQQRGMGTTVTLAYILWPRLYVVHVGDSRCYLLHEGALQRVTRDHTLSEFYADRQRKSFQGIVGEEYADPTWSHVLWNVVGGDSEDLTVDIYRTDLKVGDSLLLCTDGLSKHVDDKQLAQVLASDRSASDLCDELIESANAAGGTDNTTVIVARFQDRPQVGAAEEGGVRSEEEKQARRSAETDPFLPLAKEGQQVTS